MKKWIHLLSFLTPLVAQAIEVEYFQFSPNNRYSLTDHALLEDQFIQQDYRWIFTSALSYVKVPLSISINGQREENIINDMQTLHIGGAYQTKDFLLGLRARAHRLNTDDESGFYMGQSLIEGTYKLLEKNQFALALHSKLTFPTGSQTYTENSGRVGGQIGLNSEKKFTWFQGALNLFYSNQPGAYQSFGNNFSSLDYREAIAINLATLFPIHDKWGLNLEAYRYQQFKGDQHPNELYAGLRHQTTQSLTSFGGLATGGLIDKSSNDYRISFGLKWAPDAVERVQRKIAQPVQEKPTPPKPAPATNTTREKRLKEEESRYGKLINTHEIYFENNSSIINPHDIELIKSVARSWHKMGQEPQLVIEGFASSIGNRTDNLRLSEVRAEKVIHALMHEKVKSHKMKKVYYGDTKANKEIDEALNRKVAIRIYRKN